ncbi:uncharacterized protein LOC120174132 [Hibiscus syriacus]|uniref:uncharacterized protein LOC120174132 n=1 Tax=Hibiscus syriacus TaxID=106335 RepID=UPI001921FA92|nr:uncharacterized protein LOC120174132 [Hibiscus syriacus]
MMKLMMNQGLEISVYEQVYWMKRQLQLKLLAYLPSIQSSFAPYLEESLKILERHSGYFHEDVRLQAIIVLKHILTAAHAIFQCQNLSYIGSFRFPSLFFIGIHGGLFP